MTDWSNFFVTWLLHHVIWKRNEKGQKNPYIKRLGWSRAENVTGGTDF